MSKSYEKNVNCGKCENEFDITVWDSVNFNSDPHAKQLLLEDKFFNIPCPKCGEIASYIFPCLFHCVEKEYMIWYLPDGTDEDVKVINNSFRGLEVEAKYTKIGQLYEDLKYNNLRCVYKFPHIIEKIKINDLDMDDRVIEIAKALVLAEMIAENQHNVTLQTPVLFTGLEGEGKDKNLIFELINSDSMPHFSISFDIYENLAKNYADIIPPKTKEFVVVDRNWALSVI